MKEFPESVKRWLIYTAIALVINVIAEYFLYPIDLLEAIQRREQGPIFAVTFLILSRLFLYFLTPGWAVYLAARTLWERQLSKTKQ